MIVLKAPLDRVLDALQAVSGIVQRRHTLPILANVLSAPGRTLDEYQRLVSELPSLPRLLSALPPPAVGMAQQRVKLKLGHARELHSFFGATKVNARNAP